MKYEIQVGSNCPEMSFYVGISPAVHSGILRSIREQIRLPRVADAQRTNTPYDFSINHITEPDHTLIGIAESHATECSDRERLLPAIARVLQNEGAEVIVDGEVKLFEPGEISLFRV